MALVWTQGETIVLVKRSSQIRTQIHVVASKWDHPNECFVLSSRMVIPVAAGAELLTGGSVLDSETGLLRSYLVLGKAESIYICGLDFDQERPDLITKLPLQDSSSPTTSKTSKCSIGDCWLVDGPSVVAVWKGQLLLVISEESYSSTEFSDEGEEELDTGIMGSTWEAHVLSLPESSEPQSLQVHFCGDIKSGESQEVILSLTSSSGKRLRTNSATSERYLEGWSFYSMSLETKGPIIPQHSSHGSAFKFTLSKKMPSELDPKLITCIQPVAFEPSATGDDDSEYIFVGTKDRRLLRCRHAQIVEILHLDAIPSQLQFGVVAGGQGVLLVVLDNSQKKVVAVCPESLDILQDWSRVWRVVVGDFSSSGHDQIILLQIASGLSSEEGLCSPISPLELNFTVIHGFSTMACEGIQQGSQQHLAETKAVNDCKVSGMDTICKALRKRVEAGKEQLQVSENERDSKKELVRISTCLMQNLITRRTYEQVIVSSVGGSSSKSFNQQDRLELVRATRVWSRVCGMKWFFFVNIEMIGEARPDAALHNVSLLLTSLNCSIGGKSSVLKSFSFGDKRGSLVMCVPYQEFSLQPGLPFDVSVRASVFRSGEALRTSESSDYTHRIDKDVYTQWLGSSEIVYPTLTPTLQPKEAFTVLEQVGEQAQFVIAAKKKEHLLQLSGYMQSTLRMQEISDHEQEHKNTVRWCNLCSVQGHGPYTADLCYLGIHAVIKLKAIDVDLLGILELTLIQLFTQHQLEIVSRIIPHEALEKLDDFIKTLNKHVALQDSLMQKGHDNVSDKGRYVAHKLERAVDEKFCKIWASLL